MPAQPDDYIIEENGVKFDKNVEAMFWEFTENRFPKPLITLSNMFVYTEEFTAIERKPERNPVILADDTAAIQYVLACSSVSLGRVEPDDLTGPQALPFAAEYGHTIVAAVNGIRVSAHTIRNAVLLALLACIRKSINDHLNC